MSERKRKPGSPESPLYTIQSGTEFIAKSNATFVVTDPDSSGTFQAGRVRIENNQPILGESGTLFANDIAQLTGNIWSEQAMVDALMRNEWFSPMGRQTVSQYVRSWINKGQRIVK